MKTGKTMQTVIKISFVLYVVLMIWLLYGQRISGEHFVEIRLKPLTTTLRYIETIQHSSNPLHVKHAIVNLIGNVVMFIPLGFFLSCVFKKLRRFGYHILCAAAVIVAVELLQLITRLGCCDIDDFILNVIGAMIGFAFFKLFNLLKIYE